MRVRLLTCFIITILILVGSYPVLAKGNIYGDPFIPGRLYNIESVVQTDFSAPVSCSVAGSSGEFSYDQIESDSLTFNWTHIPGTELEYIQTNFPPGCQEFVYVEQEFYWNHNVLPTSSNLSLSFSITTTGMFHNDTWESMFEIGIWLVSPHNNWERVSTFDCYGDRMYTEYNILRTWSTDTTFQELIRNETESEAKLVVGLIPSWRFQWHPDSEPWRYYYGSVIVEFHEAIFDILYRTESEFPEVGTPLYQTTWANGYSDDFQDSSTTPDGISYLLTVEDHEDYHNIFSVTRINQKAVISWQRSWNLILTL
ncbi:MAG: hypothetical protein P1Q69_07410 [Candidatus Thorarchaeota archaeon]|nr:hypothetical protein [Candidatus Thorarchaeota archaeon]